MTCWASGAAGLKIRLTPTMLAACVPTTRVYPTSRLNNMAWVDDRIWCHPKFADLSDAAFRLYVHGCAYSAGFGTRGVLTLGQQRTIGSTSRVRRELVTACFWDERDDGSVCIHDWDEHNAKRDERRAKDRERKKKRRMSAGTSAGSSTGTSLGSAAGTARVEGSEGSDGSEGKDLALVSSSVDLDLRTSTDFQSVQMVYDHWRAVCGKSRANYDRISPARRKRIKSRLTEFSVEELCLALDGVARDPWEQRREHNDLTVVFRSQEQVERFLEIAATPARFSTNGRVTAMDMVRATHDAQRRELDGSAS